MKKKVLATLLAVTLVATSLVGCEKKETKEPKKDEVSTGDNVEEEKITATITVWGPSEEQSEEYGKWLQTSCEAFNALHPNWDITFNYGVCAEGDAKVTVTQDVEAAADVYMYANDHLPELVAANAIAELGGDTAKYVQETNSQAIVDSVSYQGAIYGVPYTTNTWFMYYDTSAFTPEEANSLDAMMAKAKIAFPLTNSWYFASFFVANGGTMFGDGTDEAAGIDFGGDKATAVTKYLVDMVANPNFIDDASGSGMAGLRDGSVKAIFSGSWDANAVKEALGENFGAKELPTITIDGEEKQLMSFAGSKAYGVNPNSKNQQIAVELAKYLGSAECQQTRYDLRSVVPCNTELVSKITEDPLVEAQNATFDKTSIIQPFVPAMGKYWDPSVAFANALINKDVTKENASVKVEEYNAAVNASDL